MLSPALKMFRDTTGAVFRMATDNCIKCLGTFKRVAPERDSPKGVDFTDFGMLNADIE